MQKSFPRSMASLEEMFAFVNSTLSSFGAKPSAGYAISLALEEIFTNLVKYNPGDDGQIGVSLEQRGSTALVAVRSPEARPFDLTQAPEPDLTLPLHHRSPGGLGIFFTREMVDELRYSYDEGYSTITFTRKLDS